MNHRLSTPSTLTFYRFHEAKVRLLSLVRDIVLFLSRPTTAKHRTPCESDHLIDHLEANSIRSSQGNVNRFLNVLAICLYMFVILEQLSIHSKSKPIAGTLDPHSAFHSATPEADQHGLMPLSPCLHPLHISANIPHPQCRFRRAFILFISQLIYLTHMQKLSPLT